VPPSDDSNHIDELKESLYSRNAPEIRSRRRLRFFGPTNEVKNDWGHKPENPLPPVELNSEYKNPKMSFFTKLFIVSAIFCLVAVGFGAYLFWNGANLISADNIDIEISGPVSVPGGEPVSFDIQATNKNNVAIQLVDLTVDFPPGTTDPNDSTKSLPSYRKLLGDLAAGATAKDSVRAVFFGEENLQKQVNVSLTYSVKGSTAVFTKTKNYEVLLNSSPVQISVSGFKEITSGQEFDLKVSLKSNSKEVLRNVLLKASYPFGFSFIRANLAPLVDNAVWKIGDLPPAGERSVIIHGTLSGEDSDLRAFHFSVGSASSGSASQIGTLYNTTEQDITLQKPFVSLDIDINGDSTTADFAGQFGQSQRIEINWFNNLSSPISNLKIVAKLSGSAYDRGSVNVNEGYFNSADNTITWSQQTSPSFASVAPGASGTVSFSISPRDLGSAQNPLVNPGITVTAGVSGNRSQESQVPQALASTVKRNIIISSSVGLSGRVVRNVGPFQNSGFVPPKVDNPSTYTIIWDIDNTANAVSDAEVTATLPPYVKWLNKVSPAGENITYNQNSGLVTWTVGDVAAYSVGPKRREAAFQISFTPNVTQVGQTPTLVNQSTLTATDSFTGSSVKSGKDQLTTRFSTDPAYRSGDEVVNR